MRRPAPRQPNRAPATAVLDGAGQVCDRNAARRARDGEASEALKSRTRVSSGVPDDPDSGRPPQAPWVESDALDAHLDRVRADPETRAFAQALHDRGVAVVDLGPAAAELCDRAAAEVEPLFTPGVNRIQDAWRRSPAVRALALDGRIQKLLDTSYGRRSFPFQTLNFLRGSQQHFHSDAIHFHAEPERFMCGVWIALEDAEADAGPLTYLPGSHRMPILTMQDAGVDGRPQSAHYRSHYIGALARRIEDSGIAPERALLKKGQALVWAANLAHGGEAIAREGSTRRSLVVHMYFEDCVYYTPMRSDPGRRRLAVRAPADVRTGGVRLPTRNGRLVPVNVREGARVVFDSLTRGVHRFS